MEELPMKKMIITSLFSATMLLGTVGSNAYADELIPTDTITPPITNTESPGVPVDPSEPPVVPDKPAPEPPIVPDKPVLPEPSEPPVTPSEPNEPAEPSKPTEPSVPVVPTDPTEPTTEPSTPEKPIEPGTSTEPSTPEKPAEPEKPITPNKPAPEKPVTPEKPVVPSKPTPTNVVVTPTGEIATGEVTQQPTVPIETSNLAEITHVPSGDTPVTTAAGEAIVAVDKGVPLTQTADGLKPITSEYKVLPSGNVQVKAADGKMKVLPYTGEEINLVVSAAGSILSIVSGFVFFKRRKGSLME